MTGPPSFKFRTWWAASVSRRIGTIMLLSVVLTTAVAAVSLRGLSALNSQLDKMVAEQSRAAELVGRMLDASRELSDSTRRAATATTQEERDAALAQFEEAKKAFGARIDELSAELHDAPELQAALQEGLSGFVISAVKASRLMQAGRQAEAERELFNSFDPKLLAYALTTISGVVRHTDSSAKAVAGSGHAAYDRTLSTLVPILCIVAFSVLAGHWLVQRTVIKPVQRVAQAAEQLAQGRFDADLQTSAIDECGEMLRGMATLREQLATMIDAIGSASRAVTGTADRLGNDNHELSARSHEQAKAVQSAVASLDSLNDMARRSSEHLQQISAQMRAALGTAQQGKNVVTDVVTAMQATTEASRRIANTVDMIREIAFKTNILALNAAVEAARAGEHGRGFAVVASEVRTLAGKSASAAKEIDALIVSSSDTVAASTRLAGEAALALQNIVRQVHAATDRIGEISHASSEQSRRVDEVSSAIDEIDAGTQRNVQMVAAATEATEMLRGEARLLTESLGVFGHDQAEPAKRAGPQDSGPQREPQQHAA
jgi:methyl-accepting chemotaxis protein